MSISTDSHHELSVLHPIYKSRKGETTPPPLTVYKASAGSGKTFTLAVEYIKLLVSNPTNYRYILAVTFTNKATQEMKQRILAKLYGIAHGLSDSDDYMEQIQAAYPNVEAGEIRSRAKMALGMLVHDYSRFRIETIDSFFQRVLRNLAHELGLTANMQVRLEGEEVESQAVDNIIANMDEADGSLLGYLMTFIEERIDDDKSWNVIGQIKEFGKNIFKDFYKDHQQELRKIMNEPDFFDKYTSTLKGMREKALAEMAGYARRYAQIADKYGLTKDNFKNGRNNAPGYFEKLGKGILAGENKVPFPNSYVVKAIDDPNTMVAKKDVGTPVAEAIVDLVGPLLREAEEKRPEALRIVNSVDLTLQNINHLRLLGRIEQEVARINSDNNDFLLSDTQKLLNDLIDQQDSPFIYEKIGGQLRFIMIDEFQDTSCVQWENFKVLLDDCLAHQAGSLIVGDVKQSIYRWRNGDWRLLQSLNEANHPGMLREEPLAVNYRSQRNVVDFNNAFFTQASIKLSDNLAESASSEQVRSEAREIKEAYADVVQGVPKDKPYAGYVEVRILPKVDYADTMIDAVRDTIQMLLSNNIPQKKIAVVVRTNPSIKILADYFLHHPVVVDGKEVMINMVSDEAFRLDASLAINVIVRAMHALTHPDDMLDVAFLAKAYHKCLACDGDVRSTEDKALLGESTLRQCLPEKFVSERQKLLSKPILDLAEEIYGIFHLSKLHEGAYICAFFDKISSFLKRQPASIDDFLSEWDNTLCSKSIQSDEVDGIRLLTIHKSKGLEFDNLIVPYCDWKVEKSGETVWMSPSTEPYSQVPVVPVSLSANKLSASIYQQEYESEHVKNVVDNLNILYVAFTRASNNLFVIGKNDINFPSTLLKDVLRDKGFMVDKDKPMSISEESDGTMVFTYGSLYGGKNEDKPKSDNIFEKKAQGIMVKVASQPQEVRFRQSNASEEFMTPDDELEERERRNAYIETGVIMHKLMASMRDYTELDKAIDQLEFSGVLYDKPMTREKLRQYIACRLDMPQVREWFSPKWKVMNECSILSYNDKEAVVEEHRPDRVIYDDNNMIVIDFKTGMELEKHKQQVRQYVALLISMGHKNVSGYLWYMQTNNIIKVE